MSDSIAEKVLKIVIGIAVFLIFVSFALLLLGPFLSPILLSGPRDRLLKDFNADIKGGLQRVVTVYSYSGAPIRSWHGKIDLSSSTKEVNMIIDNDKRVIIQGGVVIVEEQ